MTGGVPPRSLKGVGSGCKCLIPLKRERSASRDCIILLWATREELRISIMSFQYGWLGVLLGGSGTDTAKSVHYCNLLAGEASGIEEGLQKRNHVDKKWEVDAFDVDVKWEGGTRMHTNPSMGRAGMPSGLKINTGKCSLPPSPYSLCSSSVSCHWNFSQFFNRSSQPRLAQLPALITMTSPTPDVHHHGCPKLCCLVCHAGTSAEINPSSRSPSKVKGLEPAS